MEFFAFSKMGLYTEKKYSLLLFIYLTIFFFFVEIVVGFKTNSLTLVADSFHMLANIAALVVSLLSLKITSKKWSKNTFGWARAEILGALVNAVFLVALCFSITIEATKRCIKKMPIVDPESVIIVGVLGLIVNLIGFCLLYDHRNKSTPGQRNGTTLNVRNGISLMLGDSLGSIIVIISALLVWKANWSYSNLIDPILTYILVFLMLYSVSPSLLESALTLLQNVPTHIEIEAIRNRLLDTIDDVLEIHEFHVWRLVGDRIIASAHIRCRNLTDYMKIAGKVKKFFHHEGIHSTTIQPEFIDMENCDCGLYEFCALDCPVTEKGCVKSTCCQYNNCKLNPLPSPASSSEKCGQENLNRMDDNLAHHENIELVPMK